MPRMLVRYPRIASRNTRFHAVIFSALLLLLSPHAVAAPVTVPTSLLPGAQYRLAFVTEGGRDGASTNIADYDAFVQAEANTEAALSSISWQAIASTPIVDARDHTGTAPADYPGIPIFLLNEVKLVDDYADLWDGSIDTYLRITQDGTAPADTAGVWTGTASNGVGADDGVVSRRYVLGGLPGDNSFTGIGDVDSAGAGWVAYGATSDEFATYLHMYALSGVLIVPEGRPAALLTLGLAALLLVRRVRAE